MSPSRIKLEAPGRLVLGLFLAGIASAEAGAQELSPAPPKQRGAFLVPMVTVAETLDDNVFFTQFPEADFVTRVSVGLETGYRSRPFTIDVQASRAGDFFERHPEFDTTRGRTLAQVAITAIPFRPLTVSLFAIYLDTKTPGELNVASGLALGRSLATRVSATPVVEYRLGSLSTLTSSFATAHDTLDGRVADTQTGTFGFDRRITRRDTLSLRYEHRWFYFTGDYPGLSSLAASQKSERSTADVVTFGWMGEVDAQTIVVVRAGPRYGKGELSAELLGTVKRRVKRGLASVTYTKTQATTLGRTGALDTQSLVGTLALRVAKKLEIASGPGLYRNSLHGAHLVAMRMNVETLWHFSPWFHLGASYSFDLQQPDFGAPGHIRRSAFQVRLLTSPQQKGPEGPTSDEPGLN